MENLTNMPRPSLDQTEPVKCAKCGCGVFVPAYVMRKVSRLLIGAQQDGVMPIDTFACAKCGHVNIEFLPPELPDDTNTDTQEKPSAGLIL